MDILNQEFSCKHEILVLPKMYGTLDSEFISTNPLSKRLIECKDFSQVQYLHFSGLKKPWMLGKNGNPTLGNSIPEIQTALNDWRKTAEEVCPWIYASSH